MENAVVFEWIFLHVLILLTIRFAESLRICYGFLHFKNADATMNSGVD